MVRAASMPLLLVLAGMAALPVEAQQPATATPAARAAAPQPQLPRSATLPGVPSARPALSAPRVIFRDGLLTVHAHGANLAEVLNAIQRKIGASFEFPDSAAQESVAVDLGPASPHDVLAQILNGSRFDYIVLGKQDDPNEIASVMLQEKSGAEAGQSAASYPAPGAYPPPNDQEQPDEVPAEILSDDQPPPPAANTTEDQNPKTPEQMLEELKQMQNQQQQLQQQRQQQNGQPQTVAPGVPPPVPPPPMPGPQPHNYPPQQMPPDQNEPNQN